MKKYRIVSILISIVFLITVFFSGLFILEHTHHHCTGEDCPICMELEMSIHTISAIRTLMPVIALIFAAFNYIEDITDKITKIFCTRSTLIDLKVELND